MIPDSAVGVFGDVAVITVAPIANGYRSENRMQQFHSSGSFDGWRKAGMVISPNPNTIAATENFGVDLSALMAAGIIPALVGLVGTV